MRAGPMALYNRQALSVACLRCYAAAGDRCVSLHAKGRVVEYIHEARRRAARALVSGHPLGTGTGERLPRWEQS